MTLVTVHCANTKRKEGNKMKHTYYGTAFYKVVNNAKTGTQRLVVGYCAQKLAQRTAAYVSGDFLAASFDRELERAQEAVAAQRMVDTKTE